MRWRWPRIGREGGLGGWCLCFVLVWSKNLKATARRRRRERDEYSNMSSMFDLLFLIWCLTTPYSYVLTGPEFLCCFYFLLSFHFPLYTMDWVLLVHTFFYHVFLLLSIRWYSMDWVLLVHTFFDHVFLFLSSIVEVWIILIPYK